MTAIQLALVLSRYQKDVDDLVARLRVVPVECGLVADVSDVLVMVYDKENPANPYNVPVNKGNEASVYLQYCRDHYETLPEWTFFMHDEEFAWHHSGSIVDRFREACRSGKKVYNVNDKAFYDKPNMIAAPHYALLLQWYARYVEMYVPLPRHKKDDMIFLERGAAQYLVHRDCIRARPREMYAELLAWILTTKLPTYFSGRFLEWTWHLLWTE